MSIGEFCGDTLEEGLVSIVVLTVEGGTHVPHQAGRVGGPPWGC